MYSQNIAYIPKLDHLRFLAAGLVFAFHFFHFFYGHWQPLPDLYYLGFITEGHTGIALFFALSGFLFMNIALQKDTIHYWKFIRNRFLRIFPLFIVIFFLATSIGRDDFLPEDILYVFFSNLGEAPTSDFFLTGAAWTISIEFTFYFIFPFLARFTLDQGINYLLRLIFLLLTLKLLAFSISENPTHMLYSTILGRLDQFLWGMVAAVLFHRYHDILKAHSTLILLSGLSLLFLAICYQASYASFFPPKGHKDIFWVFWGTIEAILWSTIIVGYLLCRIPIPFFLDKILSYGGTLSYSIYLWHGAVIVLVSQYIGLFSPFDSTGLNIIINFVFAILLLIPFAILSYKTIEQPFLEMRQRY